jgi:Predicted protease
MKVNITTLRRKYFLSFLAVILLLTPLLSTADNSGPVYYIFNNSPQYSILPGSIYVQSLPQNAPIGIAILLNFTNYQMLTSITNEISNHEAGYLSPSQFRNEFYPPQSYKEELINYLESYGIRFIGDYGLILTFIGTVGDIEKAFNTYINWYYYPNNSINWFGLPGIPFVPHFYYFSNNVTPSLPYNLGKYIVGIVGIDNIDPKVYPVIKEAWNLETNSTNLHNSSSVSLVSPVLVTPQAIANYFKFTELYYKGYLGQGTKIAIVGVPESFVNVNDIYTFWKEFDIVPRTGGLNVTYLGYRPIWCPSAENELDAEWAGVFAPASDIYIVFSNGYVRPFGYLLNYYYEYYYMVNYMTLT